MMAQQEISEARLIGNNWRRVAELDLKYNQNFIQTDEERNERNCRIMLHNGYACGKKKEVIRALKAIRELNGGVFIIRE